MLFSLLDLKQAWEQQWNNGFYLITFRLIRRYDDGEHRDPKKERDIRS